MKLLNELLSLSETVQGTTLVGLTFSGKLVTDKTKDEEWTGNFDCSSLSSSSVNYKHKPNLTSLEGAPRKVTGYFTCSNNPELTSLKGAPREVTGYFECSNDINLETLKGAPDKVTGNFLCCVDPKLTSLKGAPDEVTGDFYCSDNPNLTSLEGAPKIVGGFNCSYNHKLTSLKDIHKQITHMTGQFIANGTPIKTNVLGLLLIKGCTGVALDNREVQKILNKYLPNTRGNKAVIDCQYELSDAGFDDFAEL